MGRLAAILSNKSRTVESSAEALLKDADGLSRRKDLGKLSKSALKKELEQLRAQAKRLQNQTLRIIKEKAKNMDELLRISNKADAKLHTNCVEDSERFFSQEPWEDTASSGCVQPHYSFAPRAVIHSRDSPFPLLTVCPFLSLFQPCR